MLPLRTWFYLAVALLALTAEFLFAFQLSDTLSKFWLATRHLGFGVVLKEGAAFSQLASDLQDRGLFLDSRPFSLYARLSGADRRIKAGRYHMSPGWSPMQILEQATLGGNDPIRVTLAPGYTLRQCASVLEDSGWISSATEWLFSASGEAALTLFGSANLEGLLKPETYLADDVSSATETLARLREDWKAFMTELAGTSALEERLPNGLTLYDTIILASLVEREAANVVEMATVASVFHNRIRQDWPMGSAATLRYAIGDWKRKERDLPVNLKSPYNTTRRIGLPPTPIGIPGREALSAALHPPDTPYMFFVADGEGGLLFSVTHEEHTSAVRDYRNRKAEQENATSEPRQ